MKLRDLLRERFTDLAKIGTQQERSGAPPDNVIEAALDGLTSCVLEDMYSGERSARNTRILLSFILGIRELHRELMRAAAW